MGEKRIGKELGIYAGIGEASGTEEGNGKDFGVAAGIGEVPLLGEGAGM